MSTSVHCLIKSVYITDHQIGRSWRANRWLGLLRSEYLDYMSKCFRIMLIGESFVDLSALSMIEQPESRFFFTVLWNGIWVVKAQRRL